MSPKSAPPSTGKRDKTGAHNGRGAAAAGGGDAGYAAAALTPEEAPDGSLRLSAAKALELEQYLHYTEYSFRSSNNLRIAAVHDHGLKRRGGGGKGGVAAGGERMGPHFPLNYTQTHCATPTVRVARCRPKPRHWRWRALPSLSLRISTASRRLYVVNYFYFFLLARLADDEAAPAPRLWSSGPAGCLVEGW